MNIQFFNEFKLSEPVKKAIELLEFTSPTMVQQKVIPTVLEEKDIIVKSQTGSGKTAAFGIPLCELADWEENKPQALVLTPTRELAIQVKEDLFHLGRFKRLKVAAVYGKSPFHIQERQLKQKTHMVVGTPGRVIDHIEQGTLDLSQVKYLVIDEADEMLNMGFIDQLDTIISSVPDDRVTMLFSATLPTRIESLCQAYMKDPRIVEIKEENSATDRIEQARIQISQKGKLQLLKEIAMVENPDSCIIFCNTQVQVDEVEEMLSDLHYGCDKIHGGMEQRDRLRVMNDFKSGFYRYLIATDVAARGIDVDNISLVVNFDVPQDPERYVHRIGRTGRKGRSGKAVTFVANYEERYLQAIHDYMGKEIEEVARPSFESIEQARPAFEEKISMIPEEKESKGAQLNQGIIKLHINAGKKTKMRAVDIVGTLCNIEGMTADDIGIINIMDISTFVEILHDKGDMVHQVLQKKPIKGRVRRVTKVDLERDQRF